MSRAPTIFNCLIRTHHITSRKKLQRVRRAASQLNVDWLLVRSGGCPGIMFAESRDAAGLEEWLATVHALRYKDFRCVAKPAPSCGIIVADEGAKKKRQGAGRPSDEAVTDNLLATGFYETESVAEFGKELEKRGLAAWWKKAMGYSPDN
ncbi:hypothetical protein V2G26_005874 [Clonostachys chloroleuca]|uniref:Uncharacterized protein n=1 Tax=Clonostachys chloroleuca TaxID=1926264 RepID=A0AA35M425_9HYPO|nr:unnamed protein product [Clonostachys chloroleuca]